MHEHCRIPYARYNIIRKQRRWTTKQKKLIVKTDLRVVFIRRLVVLHGWRRFCWTNKNPRWFFTRRRACAYSTSSARSSFAFRGQGINRERREGGRVKIYSTSIRRSSWRKTVERLDYAHTLSLAVYLRSPGTDFFLLLPIVFWERSSEDLLILCFASSVILTFSLGMNNILLCWNFENIFNLDYHF